MAPSAWDDEESESTPPSSPPAAVAPRRSKFEDEEDEDVLDDWENDADSEEEREKAKKAAEAKAKADAEAKANHKSKSQRRAEKIDENMRRKQELLDMSSDEEETEEEKRARLRAAEKEADLKNAEDLLGGIGSIGVSDKRAAKPVTVVDETDPGNAVDLSSMKLFKPATAPQFAKMRETLVPLLSENSKKPQYALFMPEFTKQLCKDLSSEQIKKVASALTTLSNEKMKEEKAADKGGKKSKAAKTKTSLNANRNVAHMADTAAYDDGLDEDDFM